MGNATYGIVLSIALLLFLYSELTAWLVAGPLGLGWRHLVRYFWSRAALCLMCPLVALVVHWNTFVERVWPIQQREHWRALSVVMVVVCVGTAVTEWGWMWVTLRAQKPDAWAQLWRPGCTVVWVVIQAVSVCAQWHVVCRACDLAGVRVGSVLGLRSLVQCACVGACAAAAWWWPATGTDGDAPLLLGWVAHGGMAVVVSGRVATLQQAWAARSAASRGWCVLWIPCALLLVCDVAQFGGVRGGVVTGPWRQGHWTAWQLGWIVRSLGHLVRAHGGMLAMTQLQHYSRMMDE